MLKISHIYEYTVQRLHSRMTMRIIVEINLNQLSGS